MSEIETAINKIVDGIWDKYDNDKSGFLEKEEMRPFYIENVKDEQLETSTFSEANFEAFFIDFDKDCNGLITKAQMYVWVMKMNGQ